MDEATEGKVDRGNAILSRFPITKTNDIFYDRPYGVYSENRPQDFPILPRTVQKAEIQIDNKIVNVFNTQGIWGLDGDDNERRLKMSRTILDRIKGKRNVILAGDFNVKPNTKTINNIEKVLINVFKDELKTTFNMKRKTDPGYAGKLTMGLTNLSPFPVKLQLGARICNIIFHKIEGKTTKYRGQHQGGRVSPKKVERQV